jgi:MFS family permease
MNRDFHRYLTAEVTSVFGSAFSATAIGLVAVTAFHASAAQIGIVEAAAILPVFAFGPAAGVLGDRLRRPRRALIICDAVAGCAVLAVAAGLWARTATIWWFAALCAVLGCVTTLVETVYFTHLGSLVPATDLTPARARLQAGEYGGATVGRALTGALVAVVGGAAAFAVDAATYLASMTLLSRIDAPDRRPYDHGASDGDPATPALGEPGEPGAPGESGEASRARGGAWQRARSFASDTLSAFAQPLRNPFLRAFTGFAVVRSGVTGAMSALSAPFLLRTLHVPVPVYGMLFAVTGLAGLAGSVVAGRLARRAGPRVLTALGCGGIAVSGLLLPLAAGPLPVVVVLAVLGLSLPVLCGAISNIGLTQALMNSVPEGMLGRAVANLRSMSTGAQVLGALGGGIAGVLLNVRPAVWLCMGIGLAGGLFLIPAVRVPGTVAPPTSSPAVPGDDELAAAGAGQLADA